MKFLVACEGCHRQFDASGIKPGSRFRCTCSRIVTVPKPRAHEAAVVRCSSCGGPRQGDEKSCNYCQADFTLRDQDLDVMCPECMTRVSAKARFCHHCGTPIAPEGDAGRPSEYACPACEKTRRLNSRKLGRQKMSVLECPSCAGIWLGHDAFELLVDRARDEALPEGAVRSEGAQLKPQVSGRIYRPCPHCKKQMNRTNFGRRSGVILDRCKDHGLWFDPGELDAVLRWIRTGGEEQAQRRDAEERRAQERQEAYKSWRDDRGTSQSQTLTRGRSEGDLGGLIDLFSGIFDI